MAVAIVTAAGAGTRLGADIAKALLPIGGRTLVEWALYGLAQSGCVSRVCVTAPNEALEQFSEVLEKSKVFAGEVIIVPGGVTRQQSVYAGLTALKESGIVLVHDAARPFASPGLIRRVAQAVNDECPAVVPGLPVSDTIKEIGDGSPAPVLNTLPRARLRAVQTPQGFLGSVLMEAHERFIDEAADDASAATDDAALVEWMGLPTFVCEGDPSAFKITTTGDVQRAESFLSSSTAGYVPVMEGR